MQISLRSLIAAILVLCGLMSSPVRAGEVSVAVASNFAAPMERIAALFQKESGHTVKVSPGASGKLYAQIRNKAPFDVFLSADEEIPKSLMQEGLAVGGSRFVYATGRLVLWSAQSGLVDEKGGVLNRGNFKQAGNRQSQVLALRCGSERDADEIDDVECDAGKLDRSDDVTQAYQLAATEKDDLAFIALSQSCATAR